MGIINWTVLTTAMLIVIGIAFFCRRYIRDVADFLSAGRVARRYVLSVGAMEEALGILVLVQLMERNYLTGFATSFWNIILAPISVVLSLTGFVLYRFRETRAMTGGQFLEMRYNRALRVFASALRCWADVMTEVILPALAARFFIYFFDLPLTFGIFGIRCSTYVALMLFTLLLAVTVIMSGGSIALMVTDCVQGLFSYPMFLIMVVFFLFTFNWNSEIVPVLFDRVKGESFLDPFDIEHLRDFNIFMLFMLVVGRIFSRAHWLGSGFTTCAKNAHEQKIADMLGTWRVGFSSLMCTLLGVALIVVMNHQDFSGLAKKTRDELAGKIAAEVMPAEAQGNFRREIAGIGEQKQHIGSDPKLSQKQNLDTAYLDAAEAAMRKIDDGNFRIQKFNTLYHQLMFPVVMRNLLPRWLQGLFMLLIVMLMVSTDSNRIFVIACTIAQDLVLPFRKTPMKTEHHLLMIRLFSLLVAAIFFLGSLFMAQLDYIQMFTTIVGALWCGGAGVVVVFGLYSRFGTSAGAFAALGGSAVFSVSGMLLQRNWADHVYPWLETRGWVEPIGGFLETVSAPLAPIIVWKMNPVKFPINSYELLFMAMLLSTICYIAVSLLTCRRPFDLDRMLHRGRYADEQSSGKSKFEWSWKNLSSKLIGITPEYTLGDRILARSVFVYAFVYRFGLAFLLAFIWNVISPWGRSGWSVYYLLTMLIIPFAVGMITTVWFFVGGCIDLKHLFIDLARRKRDFNDDGRVNDNTR